MSKPHILFFVTEDFYFWSHRRSIALAALGRGFNVTLVTRFHDLQTEINKTGIKTIPIDIRRSSLNPIRELKLIINVIKIYRREKPDIVHHVAIKPIFYGTWAARLTGINGIINAFGGLGHLFTARSWLSIFIRTLLTVLLRVTFTKDNIRLMLQNPTDIQQLIDNKITSYNKTVLIRGAGVDLHKYKYILEPDDIPVIMYAGRMLRSKGVEDLVKSAEILSRRNIYCRVVLVGRPDPENPMSIPKKTLEKWAENEYIEWWGYRDDMPQVLKEATIVVLPSVYGEGVPKVLIEAAAVGRPLIATNIPGCKEIVQDGVNGLLIPGNDVQALTEAIGLLLDDKELRIRYGLAGRRIVENGFSDQIVAQATLEMYQELLKNY